MSKLKSYTVHIETSSTFAGTVRARSESDAGARARRMWTTQPNAFEETDEKLVSLIAEEVRS